MTDLAAAHEKAALEKKDEKKKPTGPLPARVWASVKKEAAHYWAGTKLLGQEIKISGKLQWKVLNGGTLTRRERRQVNVARGRSLVWVLTVLCAATTNNHRSVEAPPILRVFSSAFHGASASCCPQAFP